MLGAKRGTKMDDLNDEYAVDCLKWVTVEVCGPMRRNWPDWGKHEREVRVHNDDHSRQRWERMRAWAVENLKTPNAGVKRLPASDV